MHLWKLAAAASALLLAACGGTADVAERPEVDGPLADTAVDDTAQLIKTTPGEPGVERSWDIDRDGRFNEAEYRNFTANRFGEWDRDGDDRLALGEFVPGWEQSGLQNSRAVFTEYDQNQDGAITPNEFEGEEIWNRWDADGDGALSPDEFRFY